MSNNEPSRSEMQFYHKLRKTIKIWAGGRDSRANRYLDYIMAGPDLFILMARLSRDDRLSQADRTKLGGAVAYFINPMDLMPELILGPPGLVDDIALAALVLHDVLETVDPAVIREHWEGSIDVLEMTRSILDVADTMVGGPIWRQLLATAQSFISGR
ncbi:MAG: DUF1232 domain-containing protein [Anaerolineae bacterium]